MRIADDEREVVAAEALALAEQLPEGSNRAAYEAHLQTPHFQEYKTTTVKMVRSLKLIDMRALDAERMTALFKKLP